MPQSPSITERSTPKSFSMRASSGAIFLRLLLPGLDAPVGDAAIEVLPELLVEFRLVAQLLVDAGVGLEAAHDARIGRGRDALGERARAEAFDPLRERRAGGLRERRRGEGSKSACRERKRGPPRDPKVGNPQF